MARVKPEEIVDDLDSEFRLVPEKPQWRRSALGVKNDQGSY